MNNLQKFWRALFFFILLAALCGSFVFPVTYMPVNAAPQMDVVSHIVISQIYGGGGNSGAPYQNDYVELFNPSDFALPLNGFSIQYAPSTGTGLFSENVTPLTLSGLLAPGQFYLVQLAGGTNGVSLPTPNATGSTAMGASDGKVALVNNTTGLACNGGSTPCTDLSSVVDLVGYGNANFYEGTAAAPAPKNTTSILRNSNGCSDSNDNGADFVTGTPNPRNTSFGPIISCSTPTATSTATSTGTATATGTATDIGTPTGTGTATNTPTATNTSLPTGTILINEVAWSGTAANSNDEWIELYNPGSSEVDITGWRLYADNNVLNSIGNPDITLSGTIAAGGYFLLERVQEATNVTADQVYSSGDLVNGGERLYLKSGTTTVDTANLDGGAWPAGTASPNYASMERVGTTSTWVTYAGTVPLANDRNGNPIKGTPGSPNWIRSATVTTITSDTPDPSLVNQNVTVSVTVVGGTTTPTGTVAITGANTNCTLTLTNGSGSCTAKFSSVGSKTLTATYSGDTTHPASNDTEPHTVSTTTTVRTSTPTRIPTIAPAQLVAINEFVPRPGHDWNNDGEVNVQDEYIEIINHGTINVNLSGYSLDDEANIGSAPFRLPAVVIKPNERLVFYGSETGLLLSDGGDGVRLLKPNGQLMDAYNYTVARYPDQGYCRLPDDGGLDDWNQNCYPTPGLQNSLSGDFVSPTGGGGATLLCPIADTLPDDFVFAECSPYGSNIWRRAFWDSTGWYGEKILPDIQSRWDVFAD